MKTLIIFILLSFTVEARVFESLEECNKRYVKGKIKAPFFDEKLPFQLLKYRLNDAISVEVWFVGKIARSVKIIHGGRVKVEDQTKLFKRYGATVYDKDRDIFIILNSTLEAVTTAVSYTVYCKNYRAEIRKLMDKNIEGKLEGL